MGEPPIGGEGAFRVGYVGVVRGLFAGGVGCSLKDGRLSRYGSLAGNGENDGGCDRPSEGVRCVF